MNATERYRISIWNDVIDRDTHELIDIARDFERAIADADSVSRCLQLSERLREIIARLERVESTARAKSDTF